MSTETVSPRARAAAAEILERWESVRENTPLDRMVAAEFRSRRYLNSRERRWISEVVYGTARLLRRQKFLLEQQGLLPSGENLVQLWETPAGLETLPGPSHPHEYLRTTLAFPDTLAEELERLLASEAPEAAQSLNEQAPVTLRYNPIRASRYQVMDALTDATPTPYSPWGLELPRRVNVHDLPGFKEGRFEIQEEASQLAVLLTDAHPNQTVVEVGSGGGGKTLALSALMENKGRIVALDISEARMEELSKRAERAGVKNVETLTLKASPEGIWPLAGRKGRLLTSLQKIADIVLIDAPCTGSGVIRRSPDVKWRTMDIPAFARLQGTLLRQSAELVKPGGHLFYVTCALETAQNEDVIAAFLESVPGQEFEVVSPLPRLVAAIERVARHKTYRNTGQKVNKNPGTSPFERPLDWKMDSPPSSPAPSEPQKKVADRSLPDVTSFAAGPYVRTWPHRHGLDAFFAACLVRKK